MPAQKRALDVAEDDPAQDNPNNHHEQPEHAEESDRSPSSSNGETKDELVAVKLSDIRKEVQCPICLGIIRKTRTVMECLHRFCRECIDKSMRMGNNECPACRTHCASRRSLRDDPNYDALIAALYPDIDKYEEEELAFHDEEMARNKQIQASIAQTFRRQAEALGKKRSTAKATAVAFVRRSRGYRNAHLRGRRNYRNAAESQGSDENEDANGNDGGKDSSSADEHTEVRPKRSKRWGGARFPQASLAAAGADGGGDENDSEVNKESKESLGASVGLVSSSSERLAWGKGGMRSHTRYGSMSGGNGKSARNSRLSKLVDYLRIIDKNDDEYVAMQTATQDDEVAIHLVKELHSKINLSTSASSPLAMSRIIDPGKDKLQILGEEETLAGLVPNNFINGYLLLAYERKSWNSNLVTGLS
ncbi:hypothetical protein F2P56_009710 [Juglans regia]|uniref:RING-type domain-containing protein n=1 Tax=Juglans regia TaxID=51240 RepID=A0A833XXS2_JUGRE|nr:hypothetical protein F2P56_009710 [Juglans regia]